MLFLVLLAGCERGPEQTPSGPSYSTQSAGSGKPSYSFAVHPLHNPKRLFERYQPLIDHLNRTLPEANFELEASRDYQEFERKFRERKPAFILPNPWQTLEAIKVGYRVQAMAGDPEDFKGIFIVRRDSGIRNPADLKGKSVSYPSPTALAACILPQYWLHEQGIDINRDIDNRYVGSQESAIMNAFLKETSAGATWPPPWRAFQKDDRLFHPPAPQETPITPRGTRAPTPRGRPPRPRDSARQHRNGRCGAGIASPGRSRCRPSDSIPEYVS